MDLTPQQFRNVQFTERRGAYDKDEVHDFLARVGTAVGQMQERVREAQRRLEASEDHVAKLEAAAREQKDADETLRRTLVLAQRTADAAIQEAKDEAEAIVADARGRADDMIVQAEETVRRDVGATRDRLEAEIRELEHHRDQLQQRISQISGHLESERSRLHGELDALARIIDDPTRLALDAAPGTDPEPIPLSSAPYAEAVEPPDVSLAGPLDAPSGQGTPADYGTSADTDVIDNDDLEHLPPPPAGWEPGRPVSERPDDDAEIDGGSLFTEVATEPEPESVPDDGPPTEAHPIISAGTSFGGSHLEELRRAVSDDTVDPEGDAAMAAFFDQDTDDEPARRFGRRR